MHSQHATLQDDIKQTVIWALKEDLGGVIALEQDITACLIAEDKTATATIITRENCVFCGKAWLEQVFAELDKVANCFTEIDWQVKDGDKVNANSTLCTLSGNARVLLTGERTALNFVQTLSGTATVVAEYTQLLANTNTQLLDTRKTIPGLRSAQKYAVTCGDGKNHRIGLFDAYLIKENHIAACGGIDAAISQARKLHQDKKVEVEVENFDELQQALTAKADIVMLDNFTPEMIEQAVTMRAEQQGSDYHTKFEVSGNMTIEKLTTYSKAGVDYLSSGALTKHVQAIDLSMRFSS